MPLFCNVVGGASVVGVAPKLHGTHMVLPFSHTSCCPRPHPQVSSSMPTPPPPPPLRAPATAAPPPTLPPWLPVVEVVTTRTTALEQPQLPHTSSGGAEEEEGGPSLTAGPPAEVSEAEGRPPELSYHLSCTCVRRAGAVQAVHASGVRRSTMYQPQRRQRPPLPLLPLRDGTFLAAPRPPLLLQGGVRPLPGSSSSRRLRNATGLRPPSLAAALPLPPPPRCAPKPPPPPTQLHQQLPGSFRPLRKWISWTWGRPQSLRSQQAKPPGSSSSRGAAPTHHPHSWTCSWT